MQRHKFTFDSFCDSSQYNIGIASAEVWGSASRDWEPVSVPSRNGDLIRDNDRFQNRKITYHCWIAHTFADDFPKFRDSIMCSVDDDFGSYKRLEDTYDMAHFHLARLLDISTPVTKIQNKVGEFDVTFDCKPQRYRRDGISQISLSSTGTINNPTKHHALPHLSIHGKGTLDVNGQKITILSECPTDDVEIDCETMNAYTLDVNVGNINKYVQLPLHNVRLKQGENKITLNDCTVKIRPNWYDL